MSDLTQTELFPQVTPAPGYDSTHPNKLIYPRLPQLQAMIVSTLHNMMHYSLLNVEKTELKCGLLESLLGDLNVQVLANLLTRHYSYTI